MTALPRRLLLRLARHDHRDRLRPLLLAAHRVLPGTEARAGPGATARRHGAGASVSLDESPSAEAIVDLVVHALPAQDDPILLAGDAAAAEARLRQLGYTRICVAGVIERATLPDVLRQFPDGQFEVSAVAGLLPALSPTTLPAGLCELARITRRWIATVFPVYPMALAGRPIPGRLERPEWWDARLNAAGFNPTPLARAPLPAGRPALYERAPGREEGVQVFRCSGVQDRQTTHAQPLTSTLNTQRSTLPLNTRTPEHPNTLPSLAVHFALDVSLGNAFTWLSVEFARALEAGGHRVSWAASEITPSVTEAGRAQLSRWMEAEAGDIQLQWTHYWPQYAQASPAAKPCFEQFAINYRFRGSREAEWDGWMRQIRASRSCFLPASRFCQEALLALGIPPERCPVLPLGYSPEIDRVTDALFLPVERGFRFLATTNSADWRRYGTDLLLEAFGRAFRPGDDACLVLRDYGGNAFAAGEDASLLAAQITALRERGLEVFYFSRFLSKEDMIRFHRACHAFVAPFRGEGFGVKVLDALACDLPAILPLYSGPADFCAPETCFPVPFREVPMGECLDTQSLRIGNDPTWCEVDVDALAETLRAVYRDPDAARARGRRAGEAARRELSWEAVCRRFVEIAR